MRCVSIPKIKPGPLAVLCKSLKLYALQTGRRTFFPAAKREPSSLMSDQDKHLLQKLQPDLIRVINIKSSSLLAQLRSRGALRSSQEEMIKVIKQRLYKHQTPCFWLTVDSSFLTCWLINRALLNGLTACT